MNAGKHALVTGGVRGIGLEIVKGLLRSNIEKICLVDILEDNNTIDMLRHDFPGKKVIFQHCDISKNAEIERCFSDTLTMFQQLDVVVNNAGILNDQDCEKTMRTNLCGVIHSSLVAMNAMSKEHGGRGGHIINLSATAGLGPTYFVPIYSASKAGIVGFTRCMGYNDYYYKKSGVKFIAICPGLTMTNINDNLKDKLLFREFKHRFDREVIAKIEYQDIASTGKCVLQALEEDQNGSVYICESDKIQRVQLPEITKEFVTKDLKNKK